jgi:hypothetical protein
MQLATGTSRTYSWSSGRAYRDFEDERASAMLELAKAMTRTRSTQTLRARRGGAIADLSVLSTPADDAIVVVGGAADDRCRSRR